MNNEYQKKLKSRVIDLASEYGRYGYRQVTGLLNMEGWDVGKDRVFTIWRNEGLKVPTVLAFVSALSIKITFGAMIL